MQKRLLLNLLLLVTAGGLSIFYFISDSQVTGDKVSLLGNIDTTNINDIIISRALGGDIIFNRQQGRWMLTSPVRARANIARINAMLRLPRSRSFTRIDTGGAALAAYQLDPPAITLQLGRRKFLFGTTDPLDERRYVLFGNTIHLINDSLFPQLRQAPIFFISHRLIPEDETISSIRFASHLVSKVNQQWTLSPSRQTISNARLQDLVSAWQTAEAHQLRKYGMTNVPDNIVVRFNSGRAAQFDVVARTPGLILGRTDLALQYSLDKGLSERMFIAVPGENNE